MNTTDPLPPAILELFGPRPAVNYRLLPKQNSTKKDKKPVTTAGEDASTTNPATWTMLPEAQAAVGQHRIDGFSIVMVSIFGVDLDGCRDPETGELTAIALDVMADLPIYWEISPSKTGIRGFGYGHLPAAGRRNDAIGLEIYASGRHLTVTGQQLPGTAEHLVYVQGALDVFYAKHFASPEITTPATPAQPNGPTNLSEADRITRMLATNPKAARLWRGDMSDYADDQHPEGNHSRADAGLCAELAWWLNGDAGAIEHWFGQSALNRDKWQRRADYRRRTIALALRGFTGGYSGKAPTPNPVDHTVTSDHAADAASPCAGQLAERDAIIAANNTLIASLRHDLTMAEYQIRSLKTRLEQDPPRNEHWGDVIDTIQGFLDSKHLQQEAKAPFIRLLIAKEKRERGFGDAGDRCVPIWEEQFGDWMGGADTKTVKHWFECFGAANVATVVKEPTGKMLPMPRGGAKPQMRYAIQLEPEAGRAPVDLATWRSLYSTPPDEIRRKVRKQYAWRCPNNPDHPLDRVCRVCQVPAVEVEVGASADAERRGNKSRFIGELPPAPMTREIFRPQEPLGTEDFPDHRPACNCGGLLAPGEACHPCDQSACMDCGALVSGTLRRYCVAPCRPSRIEDYRSPPAELVAAYVGTGTDGGD